ncbi:hypothetical protein OROMI_027784 [Orobanche minor]
MVFPMVNTLQYGSKFVLVEEISHISISYQYVFGQLSDKNYGEICIFMSNIGVFDDQEQVGSKNIAQTIKNEAASV